MSASSIAAAKTDSRIYVLPHNLPNVCYASCDVLTHCRLCERKRWHSSRLVMGLPQGQKAKDKVVLKSYTGSTKTQAVLDWVNYNLASRIRCV